MPNYRLYRLHPDTGHFIGVEVIHAADDVSAVNEIRERSYGNSVELWDAGRKVIRIDALPQGGALAPNSEAQALH